MASQSVSFESLTPAQQAYLTETPMQPDPPKVYKKALSRALAARGLDKKADRNETSKSWERGYTNDDRSEFHVETITRSNMLRCDPRHAGKLSRQRFEKYGEFAHQATESYSVSSVSFQIRSVEQSRSDLDLAHRAIHTCLPCEYIRNFTTEDEGKSIRIPLWTSRALTADELTALRYRLPARFKIHSDNYTLPDSLSEGGVEARVKAVNDLREVLRSEMPKSPYQQAKLESIMQGKRVLKSNRTSNLPQGPASLIATTHPEANKAPSESSPDSPEDEIPPQWTPPEPTIRPKSPRTLRPFTWFTPDLYPEGTDFSKLHPSHWVRFTQT